MPQPGTNFDLAFYMLINYWAAMGMSSPLGQWAAQGNVIYYCTEGLDTEAEEDMADAAMLLWQDVIPITLQKVSALQAFELGKVGQSVIVFADDETGDNPVAATDTSGNPIVVNIPTSWFNDNGTGLGSYSFTSYVHEIGHALGLGHPGPYNEDPDNPGAINYDDDALFANDTWHASIMSYFPQPNELGAGNDYALPMTPQMADILALQLEYGAATTRTGPTTYGFNSTADRPVFDFANYITADMDQPSLPATLTIYDSGGTDTVDCSGYSQDQTISLWAGTYSDIGGLHGNVGIWGIGAASDTIIENAVGGSGYDKIYGNAADNELLGGGGSDVLEGYGGKDRLYGESGEDTLNGGADDDKLYGGDDKDILHGGGGDDLLIGDDGDDFLHGGPGFDFMLGGNGFDTASYFDAQAGVTVNLDQPGANTGDAAGDTYASVEYVQGSDFDDILIGDDDDNYLWGGKYDDELHGGDGNDYDRLFGEAGADTLFASEGTDYLDGGDGFDQVIYSGNVVVDLADFTKNDWTAKGDNLVRIEKVIADNKDDDQLFGDDKDNWLHGTGGNDLLNGRGGADILDGGNDNDTVTYIDAPMGVTADLSQGSGGWGGGKENLDTFFSIENLIGSKYEDVLTGDAKANILDGGDGYGDDILSGGGNADILLGRDGKDTLDGGTGDDTLDGGLDGDTLKGGVGSDTASYAHAAASVAVNLSNPSENTGEAWEDSYQSIENITGSNFEDKLIGNTGNNILNGHGGADAMYGSFGNDTYFVDNAGDVVIENANEGNDTVYASVHHTLTANVDNLILQGGADLQGYGNGGVNVLFGNTGNNILNGNGDADAMYGADGNDAYFIDNAGDVVIENANEGNDTVFSTAHFALSPNVETLILQGAADLQGYGNSQANTLYGNSGHNLLNGNGGADTMLGGIGNDVYFVDNAGDVVFENAGEGNDAVFSTAHFALSPDVETLVLQGNADLQGYGNSQANTLYGNSGHNLLNGNGGADTMLGGIGNDVYFVDDGFDQVTENANEGTDAVFATVHFILSANVETLVQQGSANLDGTGNALANKLFGNSGDNTLDGQGNADTLWGNAGNDTFVFNVGQANGDTVMDFAGNGAAAGDSLHFIGYGAGATFTQNDATHWQVNFNGGASHEIITFMNGGSVDPSDVFFI
jgi:Ca2+-binding RTX toxin-like protein